MKTRRYHITKAQGEVIILALASSINEIEKIMQHDSSPYWSWILQRSQMLKDELESYRWEVIEK